MAAGAGLFWIGDTGIALGSPAEGQFDAVWQDVDAVLDCSLTSLDSRYPHTLAGIMT